MMDTKQPIVWKLDYKTMYDFQMILECVIRTLAEVQKLIKISAKEDKIRKLKEELLKEKKELKLLKKDGTK